MMASASSTFTTTMGSITTAAAAAGVSAGRKPLVRPVYVHVYSRIATPSPSPTNGGGRAATPSSPTSPSQTVVQAQIAAGGQSTLPTALGGAAARRASGGGDGGWEFVHKGLDRKAAERLLLGHPKGAFVLRPHRTDDAALSLSFVGGAPSGEAGSSGAAGGAGGGSGKEEKVVQHAVVRISRKDGSMNFNCGSLGPCTSLDDLLQLISATLPHGLVFAPLKGTKTLAAGELDVQHNLDSFNPATQLAKTLTPSYPLPDSHHSHPAIPSNDACVCLPSSFLPHTPPQDGGSPLGVDTHTRFTAMATPVSPPRSKNAKTNAGTGEEGAGSDSAMAGGRSGNGGGVDNSVAGNGGGGDDPVRDLQQPSSVTVAVRPGEVSPNLPLMDYIAHADCLITEYTGGGGNGEDDDEVVAAAAASCASFDGNGNGSASGVSGKSLFGSGELRVILDVLVVS